MEFQTLLGKTDEDIEAYVVVVGGGVELYSSELGRPVDQIFLGTPLEADFDKMEVLKVLEDHLSSEDMDLEN